MLKVAVTRAPPPSVAYVVARFSFPPILQLSAGKSHTSQMPNPFLLARNLVSANSGETRSG